MTGGNWSEGRQTTAQDTASAYRVLLGRPAEPAAFSSQAGQPLGAFVRGLLESDEFATGVAAALLAGEPPGDRYAGMPGEADAEWAAQALSLDEATRPALLGATTWREFLLALFADPLFGARLDALELRWSRSALVEALAAWEPPRPDAGTREADWGESIAERRAAMTRDAAERLALRPAQVPFAPDDAPLISVLTPVYQSPLEFLARAIESVRGQSFDRWELILVDDGSAKSTVRPFLEAYAALDPRIRPVFLPANAGIAAASNAGLEIARGEYLALLDHDDMLTHDALQQVADAIAARPEVDLLYSDECFIGEDDAPQDLFPKPDWSPLLMLNMHYIGHLTVHRTTRVRELGGFRSEFDFSQDYDLALRVAETGPVVVHIDRILYGWRRIEGSAAQGGKDWARASNVAALQAAVDRRGWDGFVEALPTANRVRRRPAPPPRVAIVIPSDNGDNITAAVRSILTRTWYGDYEVRVVTNSPLAARLRPTLSDPRLRWVAYDRPFNFSDKCNVGAADTDAEYLVFFNDDVRVITPDWLDSLLEVATLPGVGGVGCKLLYEDDTLQHAGMVTGVRRLVGTAFHQRPADTHELYNLGAQSVREVSLLCGALLMTPRRVFRDVGGFDALGTPVSHSDVDLCLRLREEGWTLVYTPYAVLRHIGHQAIGAEERAAAVAPRSGSRRKDKSDIRVLERFPQVLARDPYFPEAIRGLFYHDSQPRFHLHPATLRSARARCDARDVLLLSNELSNSGAPKLVLDMARVFTAHGDNVVVMSRLDGPMRARLTSLGVPVIVDSRLFHPGDESVRDLGRNFDLVVANTAVCWPAVLSLGPETDVRWYFHEVEVVHDLALKQVQFPAALAKARELWVGSRLSQEALETLGATSRLLPYGVDDAGAQPLTGAAHVRIGVFGTYEMRKGQDLALEAWRQLPTELQREGELVFHGRPLETGFQEALVAAAAEVDGVRVEGDLDYAAYISALRACDVVLVPSRNDTLPLVSLDALSAGRVVACSRRVGTAGYLESGVSGLVCDKPEPQQLAGLLARALSDRELRERLGRGARAVFEREFTHAAFERHLLEAARPLE